MFVNNKQRVPQRLDDCFHIALTKTNKILIFFHHNDLDHYVTNVLYGHKQACKKFLKDEHVKQSLASI